jgi:hypothetical protein
MCLFITVKYLYKLYGGGVYPHVESEGFRSIVNQKISYGCEQANQDLI